MKLALSEGIGGEEEPIRVSELCQADEAFLVGPAVGLGPVVRIGEKTIGEERPGPVTRKVQELYRLTILGKISQYLRWLTPFGFPENGASYHPDDFPLMAADGAKPSAAELFRRYSQDKLCLT